ncbi:MAG TPA: hypothetical protein VGK88_11425 [bacterium]
MGQDGRAPDLAAAGGPRLSVVVVARNDDYEGNFLERMAVFTGTTTQLLEDSRISYELVIVEWNPPPGRPSLADALPWRAPERGALRFIRVPAEVHRRFPNSERLPLFEYIGKNAGVRRARGSFILVTNPDVIMSAGLVASLAHGPLRSEAYYRVPRYDVRSGIPRGGTLDDILAYCREHIVRVNGHWYSSDWPLRGWLDSAARARSAFGILWELGRERAARLNGRGGLARWKAFRRLAAAAEMVRETLRDGSFIYPFSNASGDFMLMHRSDWFALRGFPELTSHSFMDTCLVFMAHFSGRRLHVLHGPDVFLYHQEHSRAAAPGRPWTDLERCQQDCLQMALSGRPLLANPADWGLGGDTLPEEERAPSRR